MKTRSHMIVTAISATFVLLMGIGDEAVARGGGGGGGEGLAVAAVAAVFPAVAPPRVAAFRPARDDPAR